MTAPTLDTVAIGNAIVDILAPADDGLIAALAMTKGGMQLVDAEQAAGLYAKMGSAVEASGGSAANTIAGMAALGARCGFIGQVADDQFGRVFSQDIRTNGVTFTTPARAEAEPPTGQCLIFVTPDGQRTMNTFLGAAQLLDSAALDEGLISSAAVLYLEGYLWNADESRDAMARAIAIAKQADRKVAFTLSDAFVVFGHRQAFLDMMGRGEIDILFANEVEILALTETENFEQAMVKASALVPTLIVTRGADGAVGIQQGQRATISAEPIDKVVDTTGAGDLFAAGFLAGQAQGRTLEQSLIMGAVCAGEVIAHYGPRPENDLKALVAARLG